MAKHFPRLIWLLILTLALTITGVPGNDASAQQTTCPALVDRALAQLDDNCADLGRNEACYGYHLVRATFIQEVEPEFFSAPADTADVVQLRTIRTSPMDTDAGHWGMALLNLQADIPQTLPGQVVRFLLIGEAEVENTVSPDAAESPGEPVTVRTMARLNVRGEPARTSNVLSVARDGEALAVDGVDQSGDWLRTLRGGRVGWIARDFVTTEANLGALPTLTSAPNAPMQSFLLNTGLGAVTCDEATPDSVLVQGPEDVQVDLNVNGVDVRLASTMLLQGTPRVDVTITTLAGEVIVGETTVQQGETATFCAPENTDCAPSPPEAVADDARARLEPLGDVNPSVLNYRVPINEYGFYDPNTAPRDQPEDSTPSNVDDDLDDLADGEATEEAEGDTSSTDSDAGTGGSETTTTGGSNNTNNVGSNDSDTDSGDNDSDSNGGEEED